MILPLVDDAALRPLEGDHLVRFAAVCFVGVSRSVDSTDEEPVDDLLQVEFGPCFLGPDLEVEECGLLHLQRRAGLRSSRFWDTLIVWIPRLPGRPD